MKDTEGKPPSGDYALMQWRNYLHMLGRDSDKLGGPSREEWQLWCLDYYGDGRGTRIPLAEEDDSMDLGPA